MKRANAALVGACVVALVGTAITEAPPRQVSRPPATEPAADVQAESPPAEPQPSTDDPPPASEAAAMPLSAQLASIDRGELVAADAAGEYEAALNDLEGRCTEPRQRIGDMAVKAREMILEKSGERVTTLFLLKGVAEALHEVSFRTSCAEVLAAVVTLVGPRR